MMRIMTAAALVLPVFPAIAHEPARNHDAPWSQADAYHDPDEMTAARRHLRHGHGGMAVSMLMAERLELQTGDHGETFLWDGQGWHGGDNARVWLKTEGHYSLSDNRFEEAEAQVLWSRAVTRYFDLQAGVRYDFEPQGRARGVLGVQGLAPYLFEIDAAAFISDRGDLTARIEVEYELTLTQRLILQPRAEITLAAQTIPESNVGAGLSAFDGGLRLRYEIRREIAPYIGIEWQGAFGAAADLAEMSGEESSSVMFLAGLRAWF